MENQNGQSADPADLQKVSTAVKSLMEEIRDRGDDPEEEVFIPEFRKQYPDVWEFYKEHWAEKELWHTAKRYIKPSAGAPAQLWIEGVPKPLNAYYAIVIEEKAGEKVQKKKLLFASNMKAEHWVSHFKIADEQINADKARRDDDQAYFDKLCTVPGFIEGQITTENAVAILQEQGVGVGK